MKSRIGFLVFFLGLGDGISAASAAQSSRAIPPEVLRRTQIYKASDSPWMMEVTRELVVYSEGDATSARYQYRTAHPGEKFKVLAWNENMARVKFENGEVGFVRRKMIDPEKIGSRDWSERITQSTSPTQESHRIDARTKGGPPATAPAPVPAPQQPAEIPKANDSAQSTAAAMTPASPLSTAEPIENAPGSTAIQTTTQTTSSSPASTATAQQGGGPSSLEWLKQVGQKVGDLAKPDAEKPTEARTETEGPKPEAVTAEKPTVAEQSETTAPSSSKVMEPLPSGNHLPTVTQPIAGHTPSSPATTDAKKEAPKGTDTTTASGAPIKKDSKEGHIGTDGGATSAARTSEFPAIADPSAEIGKDLDSASPMVTKAPGNPGLPALMTAPSVSLPSAPSFPAVTTPSDRRIAPQPAPPTPTSRVTANDPRPSPETPKTVPTGKPSGTAVDLLQAMSCGAIEDPRFQCFKQNSMSLVASIAERGRGRIVRQSSKAIGSSIKLCYKYVKMSNTGFSGQNCDFFQDDTSKAQGVARNAVQIMPKNGFINIYDVNQMKALLRANGITEINNNLLNAIKNHVSREGIRSRESGQDLRPIGSIQVYSNGSRPGHIETKTTKATYASDYASVNPVDKKSGNYPLLGSFVKKDIFLAAYKKYANGSLAAESKSCLKKLDEPANKNFMGSQPRSSQAKSQNRNRRQGGRQ